MKTILQVLGGFGVALVLTLAISLMRQYIPLALDQGDTQTANIMVAAGIMFGMVAGAAAGASIGLQRLDEEEWI